jgi:GNAT superfamily N-acetyltransferase
VTEPAARAGSDLLAGLTGAGGSGCFHALLADGGTLTIRSAGWPDYEAVRRLHEAMSPENLYFRFFSASRVSAEREARRICLGDRPGAVALLGLLGDELVGVASYELGPEGASAEMALAVADGMHRRGVATLLLEHLVSLARARGVTSFTAEVLAENYAVPGVLSDSGLAMRRRLSRGTVDVAMPIPRLGALGEASAIWTPWPAGTPAEVASLEPLLALRSARSARATALARPAGPSCSTSATLVSPARYTRSARMAPPSRASRASRRLPTCPGRPTWRW